jgi:ACS family sodium-dependent inorganic phosphate cotransporter
MLNVGAWLADAMIRRGVTLTVVRKVMQVAGLLGSATFLLLARDIADATTAQLLMCGALGALALCWSGFATNHLDVAPRYASLLMGVTNTAGTIPGVIGVAVTGWLVEASGSYSTAFLMAAGISMFGAVVWLLFGTGKRVID